MQDINQTAKICYMKKKKKNKSVLALSFSPQKNILANNYHTECLTSDHGATAV